MKDKPTEEEGHLLATKKAAVSIPSFSTCQGWNELKRALNQGLHRELTVVKPKGN